MFKYFSLICFLLSLHELAWSQVCNDPALASPGFGCNKEYQPVCGCDGNTYRNACSAQYQNGVFFWSDGPCNGFSFDIIPTFVGPTDPPMEFTFVQNKGIPATLYIIDYHGHLIFQQALPAFSNFTPPFYQIYFDLTNYRPGVYIMALTNAAGDYQWKKFVKFL